VVRLEVGEFLKGSFLDPGHSPIIAVSSLTGAGLPELIPALARIAAEVPAKDSTALARLPIDRVFTMKGFGTVVTGTLVSGTIRKEDELEVFPIGKRVRVRGVQVHGEAADKAIAGQRTALNLVGVTVEDLSRGMMLAPSDTFRATQRVDVSLSLLPSAKPLKDRARLHLHAYTSETVAEVFLYGPKAIKPGETAFAQLRMAEPALLLPGDRFIIRQFSPVVTIGGGVVLDSSPLARAKRDAVVAYLKVLDGDNPLSKLGVRIARRNHDGLSLVDLVAETGWKPQFVKERLGEALQEKRVLLLRDRYVHKPSIEALKALMTTTVEDFHKANPLMPGISREEFRESLRVLPEVFEGVLGLLVQARKLELASDLVRLPGRSVVMKDEEAESKKIIEQAFSSAGLQVPALYNVLAGLKVDKARAQKIVTLMLRDKVLIKISEELVFHQSALANLRAQLAAQKAKGVAKIDVGKFKELTGVSRKYAIPLLEYLDRERVTRRIGDERVIL
jgi:selenocysteine-specific elongation factor